MNKDVTRLYYVYDPMCAWCWGYKPIWQKIEAALKGKIDVVYLVGGLAPDSDVPMPQEMRTQIASYWHKIESQLGTEFNHDFWSRNTPRRSTYPSCRAMLAARRQNAEKEMLTAVQHAYYLHAKNPSDNEVLIELAGELGLDVDKFKSDLESNDIEQYLKSELGFARSIGGNSFPSLFVADKDTVVELAIDYKNAATTIEQVEQLLNYA
ncbi:DsbA family protein [Vibrio ezurae]|uniref:DSBA-like thioredoxin domain-containing protein n=1 Tax=Vibrio ezurae NBRC 102218 TaxID=1219080 RepID=U3B1T4_9VIBR|nr:DsbA family protein [Vibrio ezurae]GAD79402.1 hypothetical protein VEZ01S_11_00440 [Vibrio ezurae NBRC 102218]